MISVLCATTGARQPRGLEHLPPHRYLTDGRPGWAPAANALLDQAAQYGDDALFIDDDIELTPESFRFFDAVRDRAEVFGCTLFTGAAVTSAGFHAATDGASVQLVPQRNLIDILRPGYVAHVTASCLYLTAPVLASGLRFEVWPGQHYEDVAFTYAAWLRGFRVAYMPGVTFHHMDMAVGVGATKSKLPTFHADRAVNHECLMQWIAAHEVAGAVRDGRIPTAWRGLA